MIPNTGAAAAAPTYEQWIDELSRSVTVDPNDPAIRKTYDRAMQQPMVVDADTPSIDLEPLKQHGQRIADLWDWPPENIKEAVADRLEAYKAVSEKYKAHKSWNPVSFGRAIKLLETRRTLLMVEIQKQFSPGAKDWDELNNETLPELLVIIDGLLHKLCKMVLAGDSKMGKTWLCLDLAFAIATGGKWMDKLQCAKGRVLYVNLELIEQVLKFRGRKVLEEHGLDEHEPVPGLKVWTLRGRYLNAEKFKELVIGEMQGQHYDVLIIDPLYKLLDGANNNELGAMGKIFGELEQITAQSGSAIIYADHFAKGNSAGKKAMDRIAGSGAGGRDPDAIVTSCPQPLLKILVTAIAVVQKVADRLFTVRLENTVTGQLGNTIWTDAQRAGQGRTVNQGVEIHLVYVRKFAATVRMDGSADHHSLRATCYQRFRSCRRRRIDFFQYLQISSTSKGPALGFWPEVPSELY